MSTASIPLRFGQRNRLETINVAVWTVALLVCCIPTLFDPIAHNVYPVYDGAGSNWRHAIGLYPTPGEYKELLFRYSPIVAAWFAPWSLLPLKVGSFFWRVINAGVFLFGLAWYGRTILADSVEESRRPWLFLSSLLLVGVSIYNGQANALVLGLILIGVAAVLTSRFNLAAIMMAAACLFKGYPIALSLLLAAFYPRRFAPRFALAMAVGLVLPFALQHPRYVMEQYSHWANHLHNDNDRAHLGYYGMFRDLRLLAFYAGTDMGYRAYQVVQLVLGLTVAAYCGLAWWRGTSERALLHLMFGLSCCWMTVFGPATELCTYGLVAPAIAVLLIEGIQRRWHWAVQTLAWGIYALLCIPVLAGWFDWQRAFIIPPLQPLATLLLFVCLLGTGLSKVRTRIESPQPLAAPLARAA
jgi:hypothetical protein